MKRFVFVISICCSLFTITPVFAGEVRVFAASSLKDVISELTASYEKKNQSVKLSTNFGATGVLAKQIENGASADIFISANQTWIEYLKKRKMLEGAATLPFAYNTLVLVSQSDRTIAEMKDIVGLKRIAIGSPKTSPAGDYALEAIKRAGLAGQLEKKLVMARDVRECLMYAERGEVDGAFVYRTDALNARYSKIKFSVSQVLYPRATYIMGMTASGAQKRDVEAFYRYLQSAEAKSFLVRKGYEVK